MAKRASMIEHNAVLMRIYLLQSGRAGRKPAYDAIVEELLKHGFSGATVLVGAEGFDRRGRISADWLPEVPGDLPILIEVASDDVERIRGFVPVLEAILDDGLVTLERIRRL